jgi:hypothetical protein
MSSQKRQSSKQFVCRKSPSFIADAFPVQSVKRSMGRRYVVDDRGHGKKWYVMPASVAEKKRGLVSSKSALCTKKKVTKKKKEITKKKGTKKKVTKKKVTKKKDIKVIIDEGRNEVKKIRRRKPATTRTSKGKAADRKRKSAGCRIGTVINLNRCNISEEYPCYAKNKCFDRDDGEDALWIKAANKKSAGAKKQKSASYWNQQKSKKKKKHKA